MTTTSHEILGMSKESEIALIHERLIHIESLAVELQKLTHIEAQLNHMHEIFCKFYEAYESMSTSPMFAALVGKLGK